jgi:hypothetical protein
MNVNLTEIRLGVPVGLALAHPATPTPGESVRVCFELEGADCLVARFEVTTRELAPERVPEARLWDGNVVELFVCVSARPGELPWPYAEFELSPYGQRKDVLVHGEGPENRDFHWQLPGFQHAVRARATRPGWDAEMRIPLRALGWKGELAAVSANVFAILGPDEHRRRFYGLNLPAQEVPKFHLPERFLPLKLS